MCKFSIRVILTIEENDSRLWASEMVRNSIVSSQYLKIRTSYYRSTLQKMELKPKASWNWRAAKNLTPGEFRNFWGFLWMISGIQNMLIAYAYNKFTPKMRWLSSYIESSIESSISTILFRWGLDNSDDKWELSV